jgi:hypothetical protein
MVRPRVVTDLQVWMIETGRNDVSLPAELTAKVDEPNQEISERTVARWRKGLTSPRSPQFVALLSELSGGRVTANNFTHNRPNKRATNNSREVEQSGPESEDTAAREVPPAIFGLADVAAALLVSSCSDGVILEEIRRVFEQLLDNRLAGRI